MSFFDLEHPFLVPLWRRILVVVICLVWTAVEWRTGAAFWAVIASGFALYAIWALLLRFDVERARARS
jgi:hypothetical protein